MQWRHEITERQAMELRATRTRLKALERDWMRMRDIEAQWLRLRNLSIRSAVVVILVALVSEVVT